MAVVFAEGFETAYSYSDLVARGSQNVNQYSSASNIDTYTANGATGISANGGTALVTCGLNTTATAYNRYGFVSLPTFSIANGNGNLTVSGKIYYDPNKVLAPAQYYSRIFTDGTNYWNAHSYSATSDATLLAGMTSTGASASAPVRHNPITATLPNSGSVVVYDGIVYNGYMYVFCSSGTTYYLAQYSAFATGGSPVNTATATLTGTTAGTSTFALVEVNGAIVAFGTDANANLRFVNFTINSSTGAPTYNTTNSITTTGAIGVCPPITLASSAGSWGTGTVFTPCGSLATMGYTSTDGVTWAALTTTVGTTPAVSSYSCATNNSVAVFGSTVVGTTASVYTLNLSTNTWTTVKIATDTQATASAMNVSYANGVFLAIRTGFGGTGWTSTDGINWTPTTLPAITSNANQTPYTSFARGGFFWLKLGTTTYSALMFSSNGTTWTAVSSPATSTNVLGFENINDGSYVGFVNGATASYFSGVSTNTTVGFTAPSTGWHTYEASMVLTTNNSYTANYYVDGALVLSQPGIATSAWPQGTAAAGVQALQTVYIQSSAYSPTLDLIVAVSSTQAYMSSGTKNGGTVAWTATGPTLTAAYSIRWLRNKFIISTSANGWYSSTDGITWVPVAGSTAFPIIYDGFDNGTMALAVQPGSTSYVTSTDGVNWTTRTLPSAGYSVTYCAGQWVVLPQAIASTTGSPTSGTGMYSTNGTTWTTFSCNPIASFSGAPGGGAGATDGVNTFVYFGTGNAVTVMTITGSGAPTWVNTYNSMASGGAWAYSSGRGFLGQSSYRTSSGGTSNLFYVVSGTVNTAYNSSSAHEYVNVLAVNGGNIVVFSQVANICYMISDLGTKPWTILSQDALALDDVAVIDGNSPTPGPQGNIYVRSVAYSTAQTSNWTPNPNGTANNVAATTTPLSASKSGNLYVGTGTVGTTDQYGSAYTVPTGYRPISVSLGAYIQRIYTDSPAMQLQLITNDGTKSITTTVTSTPGTPQYVSALMTKAPNGNNWSIADVENFSISITKTA
jgi:hypothetical protein